MSVAIVRLNAPMALAAQVVGIQWDRVRRLARACHRRRFSAGVHGFGLVVADELLGLRADVEVYPRFTGSDAVGGRS